MSESQQSQIWYNDISSSEPECQFQPKDEEETRVESASAEETGKEIPLEGPSEEAEEAIGSEVKVNEEVLLVNSEEFYDGYGDDLMGDEKDRKWLNSLSKKKKEKVLFDRSKHRQKLRLECEEKKKVANARLDQRLRELYAPNKALLQARPATESAVSSSSLVKERNGQRRKSGGEKSGKKKQSKAVSAQEKETKRDGKEKKAKKPTSTRTEAGNKSKKRRPSVIYSDSDASTDDAADDDDEDDL